MTAYLIQISKPRNMAARNKLDIILKDIQGNIGMGSLFFSV